MANTANIFISSRNRVRGTASNFAVNLQPLISRVSSWALRQVTLDFSWYVINQNNNVFHYEELLGVPLTVTLPIGSPDLTNLCAQIEGLLNAATTVGSSYTCVLNDATQQLSITAVGPSAGSFQYLSNINPSLDYILGFVDPDTGGPQGTVAGATQTGASVVHISGPNAVYLNSSFLNLNSIGNQQVEPSGNERLMRRSNAFAQIPVITNFGSTIIYAPPDLVFYDYKLDNFTNIDIQLTDELGRELPLNGGQINLHLVVRNFDN